MIIPLLKQIRFACLFALIVLVWQPGMPGSKWTESSFKDFIDGQFLDAGSNLYVSASGRIQMITLWDFNEDGNLDILLCAGHGHTEKGNIRVYLNNGQGIDARSLMELPGGGCLDGLVTDFNKDGWNDLVVANHRDSHVGWVNAWVYYGSVDGFSADRRDVLPAYSGTSLAAGDFDDDGWLDFAIACQWQEGPEEAPVGPKMSFIYWNSPEGFQADNRLPLTFDGKGAVAVDSEDLDGDGVYDLVALAAGKLWLFLSSRNVFEHPETRVELPFAGRALSIGDVNGDDSFDIAICGPKSVDVLLGNEGAYHKEEIVQLDFQNPKDVALADVDGDGMDDVIIADFANEGGATWAESVVFYSDGSGFSGKDPLYLPTLGASDVCTGDLNGDGLPELVFSHERLTNQRSLLSYVYWNKDGQYIFGHHTQLPTEGAQTGAIGDVNNDGLPDVLFFGDEGGFRDGPSVSHVYWGDGTRGFSEGRSTAFRTHQIFGTGHADLDDDGRVDIILAQSGFCSGVPHEQNGLIIHWGGPDRFEKPTHLTMHAGYGGVRVADIDKDGYLDLLAGGTAVDVDNPERHGFAIFWGSARGFSQANRTVIPIESRRMRQPLLMDLNRDGWLDIAGQEEDGKVKLWWGSADGYKDDRASEIDLGRPDHLMYIKGADFNKDGWVDLLLPQRGPPAGMEVSSFVYYGSPEGYSNDRRTEIPSYVPYQNTIADFDMDGWLDIFLTSYGGEVSGNRPSLLYYGGPNGFLERPRTELPTYGGSGSEALDFEGDAGLDLFVANHRISGSYDEPIPHRHTCLSMLFWGGPGGFSPENRWEVVAAGPSGMNVRDLGNSYDRGLYEDYVSSAYEMKKDEAPVSISWEAETPCGASVQFQVRSARTENKLGSAAWTGADAEDSWYTKSGSKLKNLKGRWVQYRARLVTPNGGPTPYLNSVTIDFE